MWRKNTVNKIVNHSWRKARADSTENVHDNSIDPKNQTSLISTNSLDDSHSNFLWRKK